MKKKICSCCGKEWGVSILQKRVKKYIGPCCQHLYYANGKKKG